MADEQQAPVFQIQRVYLKDLSLEQPNSPAILFSQEQPAVDIQLGVGAEQVTDGVVEVTVTATITAKIDDKTLFLVEAKQGGLFEIRNIPPEQLSPLVSIACPQIVYPYLRGNVAEVLPELVARGITPDVLTDQTSAHDLLVGYIPSGMSLASAEAMRTADPAAYLARVTDSIVQHVRAMRTLQDRGAVTFDYGNNLRTVAFDAGVDDAFRIPGFVPEYIRPLFCEGKGPFRWVALSGDPADIARTDDLVLELFPEDAALRRWITLARERIAFQGLPARICWLGQGDRARFALALNDLVARGEVSAPIVIGRDHLDTGSVASPFRETEGMKDGSDAIADWAVLNALLNAASGASWVSFHHGGGVGIGNSLHAGQVIVADGSKRMRRRLARVLTNDPGIGVARHADAGYPEAQATARREGIRLPMFEG